MTGGIAYVLDENWDFYQRVNKETVSLEPVEHKYYVATLKELIREHVEETGSPRGKEILDNFSEFLPKFKKVLPYDYDRISSFRVATSYLCSTGSRLTVSLLTRW